MAELGIDISEHQSKTLNRYLTQPFDAVITVCDDANEACPLFLGALRRLHWSFPDPSKATGPEDEQLATYRAVRDAIRRRIEEELLHAPHPPQRAAGVTPLSRALIGEAAGTFLLALFGTSSVAAAVLTGAQVGLWQVTVVWGFGVTVAIYASAAVSGAHLNPAVSLAFALRRPTAFPFARLLPYCLAQLARAIAAGATVVSIFGH